MRLATLPRLVAGIATLAVAATALAMPASAAESSTFDGKPLHVDSPALADFAATHAAGRYSAADLETEDPIVDDFESIADDACAQTGTVPNSDLQVLYYFDTGVGPAVFLATAYVNRDSDLDTYEQVCSFAVMLTDEGTSFDGSFTFTVSSDQAQDGGSIPGAVSGDIIGIGPIYTATSTPMLSFNAAGNQLTPSQHNVRKKISTPKTKKQKKAAKKKYDKKVKAAKKALKKAGNTKKAKKAYKKKVAAAKKAYKKAIATYKYVTRLENYNVATPYVLNGAYDDEAWGPQ